MRSRSSFRVKGFKLLARFLPHAAVATVLLLCAAFATPRQMTTESAAPKLDSLIVCDSQTFQNCHRTEGVTPPKVIHAETPAYPPAARRLQLEGVSVVSLVIDTHGVPRDVSTAQSIADNVFTSQRDVAAEMDKNAVECVRKFRFAPATLHGKTVATQVKLKMNFHRATGK